MSEMLKKKEITEIKPLFNHQEKEIENAIGVPKIIESLSKKMGEMIPNKSITSPSTAIDYFYNNFTKIELAFLAMHGLGRREQEETTVEDFTNSQIDEGMEDIN